MHGDDLPEYTPLVVGSAMEWLLCVPGGSLGCISPRPAVCHRTWLILPQSRNRSQGFKGSFCSSFKVQTGKEGTAVPSGAHRRARAGAARLRCNMPMHTRACCAGMHPCTPTQTCSAGSVVRLSCSTFPSLHTAALFSDAIDPGASLCLPTVRPRPRFVTPPTFKLRCGVPCHGLCSTLAVCAPARRGRGARARGVAAGWIAPPPAHPECVVCAERVNGRSSMRLLLAHGADVDAINAGGRRPLQEVEMLKEFRGTGRHNIRATNRNKFAYERHAVIVDARYKQQMVMI